MTKYIGHQIAVIEMKIEGGELKTMKQCLKHLLYTHEWERSIPKEIIEYLAEKAGVS